MTLTEMEIDDSKTHHPSYHRALRRVRHYTGQEDTKKETDTR